MSDISLSLLVLKTRRLETLRKFYSALGFAFVEEQHGNGPVHFAAEANGFVIEIYSLTGDNAVADTTTRLGFKVAGLNDVIAALKAIGSEITAELKQTEWGYRAVVRDPDGRSVELYER